MIISAVLIIEMIIIVINITNFIYTVVLQFFTFIINIILLDTVLLLSLYLPPRSPPHS